MMTAMKLPALIANPLNALINGLTPRRRKSEIAPLFKHAPIAHTLTASRLRAILDAAENGDTIELYGLFEEIVGNDAHTLAEFSKRKMAILNVAPTLTPFDPDEPDDVTAFEACRTLPDHPDFLDAMKRLMDSHLFPVSVLEKNYSPSYKPGLRYELSALKAVDYRLLSYVTDRKLKIEGLTESGNPNGQYSEADRWRYIVHRGHMLTSPDYWGGPMRAILFWWLFAAMDRDWWANFLEHFGPFVVGKYEQSDDASRGILMRAFSTARRLFGLVISKETDVEVHDVMATNEGDAFMKFATFAHDQISKVIVGQTLSADAKPTGLGAGTSGLHGEVRDDIRQWDNVVLGNTLRTQLFAEFLLINGIPGRPPRIQWGGEEVDDTAVIATMIKTLKDAGLQPTDDAIPTISERMGIEFERVAPPPPPTPPTVPGLLPPGGKPKPDAALAATHQHNHGPDPLDSIASAGSADLARALRSTFAPLARIIRESKSAAECEAQVAAFTAGFKPGEAASVMENSLVAFAANALVKDN